MTCEMSFSSLAPAGTTYLATASDDRTIRI